MSLHDWGRIEERLRAVADPVGFLTNLFAHSPVGLAVWSADGRTVLTNQAFMDLFGSEPPPEYNVLEDDILRANGMLALFQRAFAGETVRVPTFWFDPRDLQVVTVTEGRRVAVSMTIFPLFKPSGEIDFVAATYKDETELTMAVDLARSSEERFRLAQQSARMGTFEYNIQTGTNTWTPELEALYGLAPGQFGKTQQSWELLVHPDDREAATALVDRALHTAEPVDGEWRALWPDGSVHWLFGRFQMVKDAAGKPHRLIGANADITSRKLAEAARSESDARAQLLRIEKDAAEAANRELEAFSYSVAHDLRSPLRAISGFSTILLEDHQITGEAALQLERVVAAAQRMDEMIDALLGLSRLSRGELQLRKVNVSKLAGSIIDALRTTAPDRRVEIAVADDVEVYADPELLRIALENLLGNAWKFTRNRSQARIEVGAVITDSAVCCHVRDDGAGFDMKYANKLFGPFQRLHTLEQFEGHGIGLATVQRIAMRHGGRVWAESAPDHGATFYLELPLHPV